MMKKTYTYFSLLLLLSLSIISCEKARHDSPSTEKNDIIFEVMTNNIRLESKAEAGHTKAEISADNVTEVKIFGKKNNVKFFDDGETINRIGQDVIWPTKSKQYQWDQNSTFRFHGYAHTTIPKGASLVIANEGKSITITQPARYNLNLGTATNTTIDYLLSYEVTFNPSKTHAVVPIKLEHVFTKVSLYIVRASSMKDLLIENLEVTFNNIKNNATLTCSEQKNYYNENQIHNIWTYDIGTSVAIYNASFTDKRIAVDGPDNSPTMSFIAIPNDHQGLKDYTISISYEVRENKEGAVPVRYERTFSIPTITKSWPSGYHVEYKFLIDNGIHLTGNIVDWVDVDYIEGTILPPIVEEDPQP